MPPSFFPAVSNLSDYRKWERELISLYPLSLKEYEPLFLYSQSVPIGWRALCVQTLEKIESHLKYLLENTDLKESDIPKIIEMGGSTNTGHLALIARNPDKIVMDLILEASTASTKICYTCGLKGLPRYEYFLVYPKNPILCEEHFLLKKESYAERQLDKLWSKHEKNYYQTLGV